MNIKKISAYIVSLATGLALLVGMGAVPAFAQTASTTSGTNTAARLAKIITRGDTAIAARITSLDNLNTRIGEMKNVSATEKANISNEVQTNISGLTTLKTKLDADTDVTTALTDDKSIFGSFRIYALVIPQGYIAASSDRVDTIVGMLTAISTKLQTRITADQTAGKDVTALQASLADISAKLTDAQSQASTALSGVVNLTPDQGNATLLASNTAALKASRADIKTATSDLQAARSDAKSIVAGLKALGGNTSASASTTTP